MSVFTEDPEEKRQPYDLREVLSSAIPLPYDLREVLSAVIRLPALAFISLHLPRGPLRNCSGIRLGGQYGVMRTA